VTWAAVAGFFLAVLPLVMTPGASFTLATQRGLDGERGAAGWVIAGTGTGIYLHATLAGLGLSVLVMRSSELFAVVKLAGAAYLIGLGLLTIWRARCGRPDKPPARSLPWAGRHAYPQAVLANVLNPKAAGVYLTLAPQFLSAREVGAGPLLVLATAHVAAMAAWLGAWSLMLARARRLTRSRDFRAWVGRIGGVVLVGLGIRTAATA
jgi:threonine/homoserine/homoserine lactone efflux protein